LITFKRGAFWGLNSIKPIAMKYGSLVGSNPAHDVMGMVPHFIFCTLHGYITLHIKEYPVFRPNEYFWKNHWDEKNEQKWECYARVIRKIIAESFDFKLV
jgi:hypothetical protein